VYERDRDRDSRETSKDIGQAETLGLIEKKPRREEERKKQVRVERRL
jgi:hypothetical protein